MELVVGKQIRRRIKSALEEGGNEQMRHRTRSREEALRALFMCDFLNDWSQERFNFYYEHFQVDPRVVPFSTLLCSGVKADFELIHSQISRASENWSLSRMSRLDRCLLCIAVFELNRFKDVPRNVIINEAIELAKRYGSENTAVFVNGVLDSVADMIEQGREDLNEVSTPELEPRVSAAGSGK